MLKLKKLHEKKAALAAQMEALVSTADTEERAMSAEESGRFDALEEEIRGIDATIAAAQRVRSAEMPAPNSTTDPDEAMEERAFCDWVIGRVTEERAGNLTQGVNGSIVPTTIANRIITTVKDTVPFLQFADVTYTNGKLSVPVYGETSSDMVVASYVDEGTAPTANVGKFSTIDLTGYVISALALLSNKLKDNTDVDVSGFIVEQVARAIAEKLETEFINGTTGKITGILSCTNVVTAAATAAITYDELVSVKHGLKQRYRKNARWIMNPSTYTTLCKLKDSNGQPYFKGDEYKILGLPVHESDSMPEIAAGAKAIVCADLTGYSIKATKKVEIKLLREAYAIQNMTGVLAFAEYDGNVTDNQKIVVFALKAST